LVRFIRVTVSLVLDLLKSEEPELVASIEELYELKKAIWDIPRTKHLQERRLLRNRKDILIFSIKQKLNKIRKNEAHVIKRRLWNDLRVVV
jgi:hypothetical protein